jgi:ribosomal protein L37AE/L43A
MIYGGSCGGMRQGPKLERLIVQQADCPECGDGLVAPISLEESQCTKCGAVFKIETVTKSDNT